MPIRCNTPQHRTSSNTCKPCRKHTCKPDWKPVVCGNQLADKVSSYTEPNATYHTPSPDVTESYQVAVAHISQVEYGQVEPHMALNQHVNRILTTLNATSNTIKRTIYGHDKITQFILDIIRRDLTHLRMVLGHVAACVQFNIYELKLLKLVKLVCNLEIVPHSKCAERANNFSTHVRGG